MFTLNKTYILIVLIVSVTVFGSGFLIGQKITRDYYRLEIRQLESKALQLENEYLVKKISTENALKNKVNEVLTNAENQKRDLNAVYNASVDRVQSLGGSSNEMQLPDNATVNTRTESGRGNQCHTENREDFNRLSKRLLELAKEHDLLKVKYNTLLKLWKQTEQEINNFN